MNDDQVRQIDQLAEQALGNSTGPERARAESMLNDLRTLENLPALRYVLERSNNQYSHFVCAKTMLDVVTDNWNSFAAQGQSHNELRSWLVSFIGQRGHLLEKFVLTHIMSILCRVTRFGWLDNESFQELPQEIHRFFICSQTSPDHPTMGLMLLNQLVTEINTSTTKLTLSQHRKTIVSFRDKCLLEIFKVALSALESAGSGKTQAEVEMAVTLALSCLMFDFVGIFADESCEDVGTVQIPSSWKSLLLDANTMQMFWKLYGMLPPPHSTNILKCVVQFASVRRSLFADDAERSKWLGGILSGILEILRNKIGLNNESNYHEFCRLLSRIKPNYQLAELVNVSYYDEWIQLTAQFTIDSFVQWETTANSSYFLLSLWARLLAAQPYLKSGKPSLLEQYAPDVVFSYIQSRLNLARATVETPNKVENALEDNDMLLVQLESLPVIARSLYSKVGPYLMSQAMPDYNQMNDLLQKARAGGISPDQQQLEFVNLQVLDSRLAWLVYMMGSIVSHHSAVGSSDPEAETLDGQLTALVLQLSQLVVRRLEANPGQAEMPTLQRLQSGILYFVNGFRKVYIGEASIPASKVYPKLKELTGLEDSIGVLRVIVDMVLNILKVWKKSQRLINEALNLFLELSTGYSSGRTVLKLDTVKLLLQQHTHPSFSFVDEPENSKQRTRFYKILANLLFRLTSSDGPFEQFMKPLQERANHLQVLQPQQFLQPEVKAAVIGWLRDVRGVCSACANKRTYGLLFDWVFPYISTYQATQPPLLPKICQVYAQAGQSANDVLIPLLRLYSDLVYNQAQRISFEPSSPSGILLFKEASALLRAYGIPKLQELSPQSIGWNIVPAMNTKYEESFKGVNICINILARALHGSYCNFGVFALYGDSALDDALEVVIKLMLTISIDDILAYPKLGKSYYYLLEILFNSHTPSILQLPSPQFLQILLCLEKGVMSIELAKPVSLSAATAMGHLCTFYYSQTSKASVAGTGSKSCQYVQQLQMHLGADPTLLNRVLGQMFHIVLFDEQANQWSISRPMLPLILVADPQLQQYQQTLMSRIAEGERQKRLHDAFEKLLEGVEPNLEQKTRDKFTGNVTAFKHNVRYIL
eukprot:TRINITY_DN994_c0_g4_i2.p1 TRINITY_DN994_c0_g4~~TRINITY_DN994_c0_g4_i2.p1  ORF type:complete len:1121 (+),score=264.73 TRINITY_DN994_c0_g4_i2:54-3365(+)